MANTKSARKRARQTVRKTLSNKRVNTRVKTELKKVRAAIEGGKKADAQAAAVAFSSVIDKAANSGRVHKNKANRHKATIARQLAALN